MWVNQIFSLIKEGVIQNIVVCDNYTVANELSRLTYGDDAIAVDTTLYPVNIGSKYLDGTFYQDDGVTEILPNPTEAQEISRINTENIVLTEYIIDLDYRMSLKEMGV
jgi:hypothetical protein